MPFAGRPVKGLYDRTVRASFFRHMTHFNKFSQTFWVFYGFPKKKANMNAEGATGDTTQSGEGPGHEKRAPISAKRKPRKAEGQGGKCDAQKANM